MPDYTNAITRNNWEKHGEHPSALDYAAVGDGQFVNDVAIAATDKTLTSASNPWVSSDVGKPITVDGAGAAGAILKTTVASFTSAGEIELTDAAGTTVAAVDEEYAWWGTDDSAAINSAIQSIGIASATGGGALFFPPGCYMVSTDLLMSEGVILYGARCQENPVKKLP